MIPQESNAGYSANVSSQIEVTNKRVKFLANIGRGLLETVDPSKVAQLIGENVIKEFVAQRCTVVFELNGVGVICHEFDETGEVEKLGFRRNRFSNWLKGIPPKVSFTQEGSLFFESDKQVFESIVPIQVDGEICGAIVLGFDQPFAEEVRYSDYHATWDALAQIAALSLNLSSHYDRKLNDSVEAAREEQRKFTKDVLDALPVSIYVIDPEYKILMWNQGRESGFDGTDSSSLVGKSVFDVLSMQPADRLRSELEKVFETGEIERSEQQTTDENGDMQFWVTSKVPMKNEEGIVSHVISIRENVTKQVEAIHGANRAEKLAAVGRLASGVVHEINNPLATISACTEALKNRAEEGVFGTSEDVDNLKEYLDLIGEESIRCKTITAGLLEFSRGSIGKRYPIVVGDLLKASIRLLSHQNRDLRTCFEIIIEDGLPLIEVDEQQIQQAIIALSTNAIDAIDSRFEDDSLLSKGETGKISYNAFCRANRVVIEIRDNGIGIEQENLSKIFDPFYTSKELGKGTGLGLAVSYGIITDHGGQLAVRSKIGRGSTFSIYLPCSK